MTNAGRFLLGLGALWVACCGVVAGLGAASAVHAAAPKKDAARKAHCGNNRIEPGETCDDGNTKDGDYCPSNCRIETCKPTSTRFAVSVELVHPVNVAVGGVVVFVDYPEGAVSLPGGGGESSVASRISNVPKDFASSPYDLEYALRETIALPRALPAGEIFRASFDLCEGAQPPLAKDFTCRVEEASAPGGQNLPLAGFACSVKTL
jgi:cysteine-rich repeat protein